MKIVTGLLCLFLFTGLTTKHAFSQGLGGAYSCKKGTIYKKNKEITFETAKRQITAKIKKLGKSENDLTKKKIFNQIKKSLKTCATTSNTPDISNLGNEFGPDLTGFSATDFISENYQGSYLGGSAFGDMAFDVGFSEDSLIFSFHLWPGKYFINNEQRFTCEFKHASKLKLPALTKTSSTGLGNILCKFSRKTYANMDFFLLNVINDTTPLENRANPEAAKFTLSMFNKKDPNSPPGFFEGSFTTYDENSEGILGTLIVVK
jgi:hypothetical protein